ncbi:hypothetical protein ACU4GI_33400 [Cupriavidus basilensis]
MKFTDVPYEAFGDRGDFVRPAIVIHELPSPALRLQACRDATTGIATALNITPKRSIHFGAPVHLAFGITRPAAQRHAQARLLLTNGGDVPLVYCN